MSFIAKNPLILPEIDDTPSSPKPGMRGLFAKEDGFYEVDSNNNAKRITAEIDQTYSPKSENAQSGKAVAEAIADIQVSGGAIQSDWDEENTDSLAYILNKPNIPTKISDLIDDTKDKPIFKSQWAERADDASFANFAGTADVATLDSKYNVITETYSTKAELATVEKIAKGRATGYVFDTVEDMNEWLAQADNVAKLVLGDNLYIRAVDVPDYWWDNESLTAQPLETQKVDLTEYAKKDSIPKNISQLVDDTDPVDFLINWASNADWSARSDWAVDAVHDSLGRKIVDTYVTGEDLNAALDESIALCDSYISWEVPV